MLAVFIVRSLGFPKLVGSRRERSFVVGIADLTIGKVFIVISSFTMLNMLLGILVEVVASTAEGGLRVC